MRYAIILFVLGWGAINMQGQQLHINANINLTAQITLGNQNKGIKIGAYGAANTRFDQIALELGATLYSGYLFKRHTLKTKGTHYGYSIFSLIGYGKNDNLLVSSFFDHAPLMYNRIKNQNFSGVGFGFEKEWLPVNLKTFNQKIGKLLFRFARGSNSLNIQFKNDFRFGKLFNGDGTDFGSTGAIQLSYSSIYSRAEAIHFGIGLQLFTPKADYSKTPNNPINSDDGSQNVWHTLGINNKLFYANAYGFGAVQNNIFFGRLNTGVNSQKLGAFIQNTLHDGFGLNPRFPWDVTQKDKLFFELNTGIYVP